MKLEDVERNLVAKATSSDENWMDLEGGVSAWYWPEDSEDRFEVHSGIGGYNHRLGWGPTLAAAIRKYISNPYTVYLEEAEE